MQNIRVIFFGTPHFVVPVVEVLKEHFELVGVVTTPDEKVGRKQILTATPVAEYAVFQHIQLLKPDKLTEELIPSLKNLKPDLFIVAAYGKIVPQFILDIPKYGSLNIHPSLLPKYRGPAPLLTALLNGDKESGITIMQMDAELDHGPIISTAQFEILDIDTSGSLIKRVFEQSAKMLVKIIPQYVNGELKPRPQNHDIATYTNHITKQDGYFEITNPPTPETLDRMIRAYYPWPNVWTKWEGKIVKFYPNNIVQIEGKKPVPLKEFLNGYPNFPLKLT